MNKNTKVGIVGAGIQGVSNALFLQKKGFDVTIFDRDNPGSQAASYGNAGHFSPYASLSLNRTDVLADVPAMLLSSSGPLALKWNYVPKMIPWFIKFIMNTTKTKMMHTAKNMHQILDLALPAYDELFEEIDLEGLVENKGILYIWNDKDLKSRELEIKVRDELGVEQQLVTKAEIHDLEPHIKPFYHAGVYYPYARHARNPKKILLKLFDLFLQKGGKFNKVNIKDINFDEEKPVFKTETQSYVYDKAVIACGAFSKKLTDNLGEKIPLDTERGYNVTLPNSDFDLKTHLTFAEHGFVVSTINKAIRVGGAVEFAGLKRPPNFNRASALLKKAENFMPGLLNGNGYDKWMGFRPSLPDSLPVIDYSTLSKRVLYAFGHGHLGLTQAAGTAELVRDLIIGQNPAINISAFSAKRF